MEINNIKETSKAKEKICCEYKKNQCFFIIIQGWRKMEIHVGHT